MDNGNRELWRKISVCFAGLAVFLCVLAFVWWLMSMSLQTKNVAGVATALSFATVLGVVSTACGVLSIKESK